MSGRDENERIAGACEPGGERVSRRWFARLIGFGAPAVVAAQAFGAHRADAATGTWSLTGNAGTAPPTDFLGSTDSEPVVIKTNNSERLRVTPTGAVGVNTQAPSAQLHVKAGTSAAVRGDVTGATASGVEGANTSGTATGVGVKGSVTNVGYGVYGSAGNGFGVFGIASGAGGAGTGGAGAAGGIGVWGTVPSTGDGVHGSAGVGNGVHGIATTGNGVLGTATTSSGVGVRGSSLGGYGVQGSVPDTGYGVYGSVSSGFGVYGFANTGHGVTGVASSGNGVVGTATTGTGVTGTAGAGAIGVSGSVAGGSTGRGVSGSVPNAGYGVYGSAGGGFGVYGTASNAAGAGVGGVGANGGIGVQGTVPGTGFGVRGVASGAGVGVYGECGDLNNGLAAHFVGNVLIDEANVNITTGLLSVVDFAASGTKHFKIDHPQDPANKFLVHACIESPEVLNLYSGEAVLDADGRGRVDLPGYFHALNDSPRVQLTGVGEGRVFLARDVVDGHFEVGGDPGQKIYWQVSGIRQDAWMRAHPMQVEIDKVGEERGCYVTPDVHGAPHDRGIRTPSNRSQPMMVAAHPSARP